MELSGFRASGERAASYEEARRAVEQAALDEAASRDRALLQELLERFAAAYARGEGARVGARLRGSPAARAQPPARQRGDPRARELRFRSIMVDEFQDTNRLQCELVDLLRGPDAELFFVGDEFQSIYGFRHADVRVFRERRAQAAQLLPLTLNYRSRPEVLAAVNELFGSHFGDEFQPLAAAAEFPDPVFGHPGRAARHRQGELLGHRRALAARRGALGRAARPRARRHRRGDRRARSCCSSRPAPTPSGTRRSCARRACRRTARPARGYFGQQQVVDLLAYLRLLHNRYDDARAPHGARVAVRRRLERRARALRRAASKRPLFAGHRALAAAGARRARRRGSCARSGSASTGLRDAMPRLSLERLCERIVSEHDYDLAVLAQWDGRRRYANMRKLARLARSYEELRGPDVEGFVRFVAEQEAVGARELEAVAEEEGADAVRLLTIHAAKGLEFKVVIVADAGRDKAPPLAGRDPRALRRPLRLPRRRPGDDEAPRRVRLRRGARGAPRRGGGREAAPLLRRDDAREGAADRLRLDRPREDGRCVDADRLGARPPRRRRGARRPPATRRSRSSATRRGSSCASTVTTRRVWVDGSRRRRRAGARGRPARALRGARGGGDRRRRRRVLPPLVAPAEPPLHRRAASRSRRSRRSTSARTSTTRSTSRA